jgi:hypothetical protein
MTRTEPPFLAKDSGSRLDTPGIDWRPSELYVRVYHRAGSYVIYQSYGYTGWGGRGLRKYFPKEYTLAKLDPDTEGYSWVTPLDVITPGRKRAPLQKLVARCDRLGAA